MIERTQIITRGWSRVDIAKIEHSHRVRVDTIDKRVVGIEYERIDFLQLVSIS
jgi:hypothetical protein